MGNKWYFVNVILFFVILLILTLEMIYETKAYLTLQLVIILFLAVVEMFYIFAYKQFHYLSLTFFIVVLLRSLFSVLTKPGVLGILVPLLGFAGLFVSLEELNVHLREQRGIGVSLRRKEKMFDYPLITDVVKKSTPSSKKIVVKKKIGRPKKKVVVRKKVKKKIGRPKKKVAKKKVKKKIGRPKKKIKKRKIRTAAKKLDTITASRYVGKILGDRKTGLAHKHDCTFARKILRKNLEVFNSERDAMKNYRPHRCLLP